jgi:hypothetical protein
MRCARVGRCMSERWPSIRSYWTYGEVGVPEAVKMEARGDRVMRRFQFHPRTVLLVVGGVASITGLIGGIAGMLAGLFAPEVTIGLYALDGPEPPPTFNPAVWGAQQGSLIGLCLGAGAGMTTYLLSQFIAWRPRITTRWLMIAVAVVGIGMGLVSGFARSPGVDLRRLLKFILFLVGWTVALNVSGFFGLWVFRTVSQIIHGRRR